MAKKKNKASEEDDWFDDDDDFEEEEKPKKKKKGKRKKKGGKVIAWIVAFVVILAILLFIRFRYAEPQEEAPLEEEPPEDIVEEVEVTEPEEGEEGEEYVPPKETGPSVVEKDELEQVREVVDTTQEPELFSNVECNYDYDAELLYISLRVYNTLDEDIKISPRGVSKGYNTYFLIRGIVDQDPGCGTELVQPGEWTECDRIGFDNRRYGNVEGLNRISVQVPGKTEALLVECPEMPEPAEEEASEEGTYMEAEA